MELVFAQPPVFSQVIHLKVSFNNMQLQTSFIKKKLFTTPTSKLAIMIQNLNGGHEVQLACNGEFG